MTRLTKRIWADRERAARQKAGDLLRSLGLHQPPIPLAPLVEARNATVTFRPLLVSGATAPCESGFKIYCQCPKDRVARWTSALSSPDDLGRSLPARTRFTLAHEIAHTLLFDTTTSPPTNRLPPTSDASVAKLERLCDELASEFLLPHHLLASDLQSADPFEPDNLRGLADLYGVSLSTLILRISGLHLLEEEGALFSLSSIGGTMLVEAAAIHTALCKVIPKPKWRSPFSALRLDTVTFPSTEGLSQSVALVPARPEPLRFETQCRTFASGRRILTLRKVNRDV